MKKLLCIALTLILCVSFIGCGTKGIDKTVYESGVKAIEVFDAYWDMEISEDEADEKLEVLRNRVKAIDDESETTSLVYTYILSLNICTGFDDTEGMETRNKLAEELGVDKR